MSVKSALYRYLTEPTDLDGLPARPFTRTRVVNGLSIANRNDARRWFRDRVGTSVFADRIPQGSQHAAVELRSLSSETDVSVNSGAVDGERESLSVFVYTRGGDAALRAETIADLLSLAIAGYHGDYWGDTYIGEALPEGRSSLAIPPGDASDKWTHQQRLDFSIIFVSESTPAYAADELTSIIGYQLTDTELRLSGDVLVPEGRTLTAVTWTVRETDSEGTLLASITGAPNSEAIAAGVTGTKQNPVLDVGTLGIVAPVYVSLIAADDSAATSLKEVIIDGS